MNKLSSILGAAAVMAIAVVFILQFRPATGAKIIDQGPQCVAEVHGACIPTSHFWAAFRLVARRVSQQQVKSMGLRKNVAEGLVERFLLNEDAKRLGITVDDADISRELRLGRAHVSLPADRFRSLAYATGVADDGATPINVRSAKTKQFDLKTYEKEVRFVSKMSLEDFREFQRQELVAARMRDIVRTRAHVSEAEAFSEFAREKSTVSVDYVKFDRRYYADVAVDRSPKSVEAWADKNKDEIEKAWGSRKSQFLPECRVTRHVLAKFPNRTPTDEEKATARKRIEKALERVQGGEDFAAVARAVSDDTSAPQGGDLGCVAKGRMVKPFEEAVFSLDKGKVSGVVETEYGFHIVKVEQVAKDADAEKLGKDQTRFELYLMHEAERLAAEAGKSVLAAVQGGKSLADAVKAHVDELAAKSADKKDEKKDKKKDDAKKDDAKKDEHEPVTAENHPGRPSVETSLPFNVSGEPFAGAKADASRAAFELKKVGDVAPDLVNLEQGYAIMQLKEKQAPSKEAFDKDREFYLGAMRTAKQDDALFGYVKRLKSTIGTDVKYNQSVLAEPKESNEPEAPPEDEGPE